MRLFILERTPLSAVSDLAISPGAGDVVAYLRVGQDPDGTDIEALRRDNVEVIWAEGLLDSATSLATDRLGAAFLNEWYFEGTTDVSDLDGVSFGRMLEWEVGRLTSPRYMIRTGEIIRRVMANYGEAQEVISDCRDGEGVDRVPQAYRPTAQLVRHVVESLGGSFRNIDAVSPLPPLVIREYEVSWKRIIRSWLGGFRPVWLFARLKWWLAGLSRDHRPTIYAFIGRGTDLIVNALARRSDYRVIVNRTDIAGALPLRHDHLVALPSRADISHARRLRQHVLAAEDRNDRPLEFNGIDYGPILYAGIGAVLDALMMKNLVTFAQAKKLQRITGADAFLINGDTGFLMGGLVERNKSQAKARIYYVFHGLNTCRYETFSLGHNNSHVVYFVPGSDHLAEFGTLLPDHQKPERHAVGNPLTALTQSVRGNRSKEHGKRILILGTGYAADATATRSRTCDLHLTQILKAVRELSKEGWRATYRGHPHHAMLLERHLARSLGMDDSIEWDTRPEFTDSLLEHDVVISALSSTFYQSLYAGWPTIYFDPNYLAEDRPEFFHPDDLFVGLLVARDLNYPLAMNTDELLKLLRDSLDPDAFVSRFPHQFSGELAPRFVGSSGLDSHQQISRIILDDLGGVNPVQNASADAVRETA